MRLAVITPCLTGTVHMEHSEAVSNLRLECHKRGIEFQRYWNKGSSILPRNRNVLAAAALADHNDLLLWIDDDIAFNVSDVFRLISHDVDLVGACAQRCTKQWGERGHIVGDFDVMNPDFNENGLIRARGVATAFQLVKADAFRRVDAKPLRHNDSPEHINKVLREWFYYRREDGTDLGEDYTFCRLCQEAGMETLIDPDIRLHHFEGNVDHCLSLRDVLKARDQALAAQKKEAVG